MTEVFQFKRKLPQTWGLRRAGWAAEHIRTGGKPSSAGLQDGLEHHVNIMMPSTSNEAGDEITEITV